jgi:hypothetical protein
MTRSVADELVQQTQAKIIADQEAEIARLQELLRGIGANRYWEGRWRDAEAEVDRLQAKIGRLKAALEVIAGHDGPDTTYVWFDEPKSREIARKALANEEGK